MLLTDIEIWNLFLSIEMIARLSDVSTTPGNFVSIALTPCGMARSESAISMLFFLFSTGKVTKKAADVLINPIFSGESHNLLKIRPKFAVILIRR